MKKILALLFCVMFAFGGFALTGCADKKNGDDVWQGGGAGEDDENWTKPY